MIFTKINCLRHAFRVVGNQGRRGNQSQPMVFHKYIKETFLLTFFSLVRKERKGQKEERFDSRLGDADTHASRMCQFPRRPAMIHKSTFPVLLPWLVFSTLSRTFSPWRKFSLRGQGWRRPFSCASSSFRIARPVYSCECLNPARDNPASAR